MKFFFYSILIFTISFLANAENKGIELNIYNGKELLKKHVNLAKYPDQIEIKKTNKNSKEIVLIDKTITLEYRQIFDGKGKLYIWTGKGICNQDESQPPMFVLKNESILKNMYIFNAPDGIHVKGSNIIINNIVNLGVCEDAISSRDISTKRENIVIKNSIFANCEDKAIHLRNVGNVNIINNKFQNCNRSVSIRDGTKILIEKNIVEGFCEQFILKECGESWSLNDNYHSCDLIREKEPKLKHFRRKLKYYFEYYHENRRKRVQNNLVKYGYKEDISGLWNDETEKAIINFIEEKGACNIKGPEKEYYSRNVLRSIVKEQ